MISTDQPSEIDTKLWWIIATLPNDNDAHNSNDLDQLWVWSTKNSSMIISLDILPSVQSISYGKCHDKNQDGHLECDCPSAGGNLTLSIGLFLPLPIYQQNPSELDQTKRVGGSDWRYKLRSSSWLSWSRSVIAQQLAVLASHRLMNFWVGFKAIWWLDLKPSGATDCSGHTYLGAGKLKIKMNKNRTDGICRAWTAVWEHLNLKGSEFEAHNNSI